MARAPRLLVAALLAAASPLLASGIPPRPDDRAIHDLSGTLGSSEIADLERRAEDVLRAGAAVAVLVRFHRSDADETRDEARRLLRDWEVEREAGRADGVAIVVNLKESDPGHGVAAIHVGKGLRNGNLPKREVERIWRDEMRPALRNGHVADGIAKGLDAVARSLRDGPAPPSPAARAAAELATGALLPAVIVAGVLGVFATVRLSRRPTVPPLPSTARNVSLGPVRGGVLARRRLGDGAVLGGLLDLASRGAVTLVSGAGGTLLARPTGRAVDRPFEASLLQAIVARVGETGVADLGTSHSVESRLGEAVPLLRADLVSRGLLDPLAGRRSVRTSVMGGLLLALAGVLLVAAAVGEVPGPAFASLLTFGSGTALLIRAATLPETTEEGEREGQAWRAWLAELDRTPAGKERALDLGEALPFLLASGRPDLVQRHAASAASAGCLPAWLSAPGGPDGSEAAWICAVLATSSDTTVSAGCSDGGASAGGSF
jgi:uncharacterized membrane protein YgcG